jgi:hypothetical protein
MITTNIEWHKATEELPAKSGYYMVTYGETPFVTTVQYSSKHKRFNAWDTDPMPTYAMSVDRWARLPKLPEIESEDE